MDLDWRPFRDESGDRRGLENVNESRPVKGGDIGVELRRGRRPQSPARMFDAVFAAAGAPGGVTPIMFRNEFLMRTISGGLRFAGRSHGQRLPPPVPPPLVLGRNATVLVFESVSHR